MNFFFKDLSLHNRLNQNFFKNYLKTKNFSNIWKIKINPKQSFSYSFELIRFFLKIIFLFNKKKWHDFERKYLNYFLDTSLSTMFVNYTDYIKGNSIPRNSILFYSRNYIKKFLNNE